MSTMLKTAPLGTPLAPRRDFTTPGGWRAVARRLALAPVRLLMVWQRRIRDRETLRAMTPYQLQDIGIGGIEALQEAEKPFWRP